MSEPLQQRSTAGQGRKIRHTVGIDLGTSSLRIQIAHYDALGRPVGEPAAVHLPNSERDGSMPTVVQMAASGEMLAYGRAAVQRLPHTPGQTSPPGARFAAEFKPCIGQAPEDLAAQGRPELARMCTSPRCSRPGWAWSVALQFCGFCGAPLDEPAARWQPQFLYAPEEALQFARLLLTEVRQHLERRLNEPLRHQTGWQVVAGVPVHWQAGTRASYQQVLAHAFPEAEIALLSEPEGALRYYGCQGLVRAGDGWTMVVDFGAGTTDLVLGRVLSRGEDQLLGEVRAYGERYGGTDFDLMLARHAAAELGVELDPILLARWKLEAQRWKEAFSDTAQFDPVAETGFSFPVPMGDRGCDFRQVVLDRPLFGRVAGELVERFRGVLQRGMRHFRVSAGEITQVVLTGGGAQWYFVEEAVRELCPGANVVSGVEPVRAIARGLALAPALLQLLEAPPRKVEPNPTSAQQPVSEPASELETATPEREPEPGPEPAPESDPGEEPLGEEQELTSFDLSMETDLPEERAAPEETRPPAAPKKADEPRKPDEPGKQDEGRAAPGLLQARLLQTIRATGGKTVSAALSPDGAVVATGHQAGVTQWGKGSITFWEAQTGRERQTHPGEIPVSLAYSPDGERLAALFYTGAMGIYTRLSLLCLRSGSTLWTTTTEMLPCAVAYSADGQKIVNTFLNQGVGLGATYWHAENGKHIYSMAAPPLATPTALALSADGTLAAFPCDQGTGTGALDIRIYGDNGRTLLGWLAMPERGFSMKWALQRPGAPAAFTPDGQILAVGSRGRAASGVVGRVHLFRWRPEEAASKQGAAENPRKLAEQGRLTHLEGHRDHVQHLAMHPGGRMLASGSEDGSVILWDLEAGRQTQVLTAHTKPIAALEICRTGDRMMTASSDGMVQVWALG